jgi:hypothetical protein
MVSGTDADARVRDPFRPLKETREDLRNRLTGADTPLADRASRGPGEDLTPPRERAAREGRAPRTAAQIMAEMDPEEQACRGQEHTWPTLKPNAPELPRGMSVSAAGGGCVLIREDCLNDCGRYRETLTGPRGFYDSGGDRRYATRRGRRHTVIHRDEAVPKSVLRKGTFDTNAALFREAAKASSEAMKAEAKAARDGASS